MRKYESLAGLVFVLLLVAVISGCSGGGSIGTTNAGSGGGTSSAGSSAINISLSETRTTVDEGATAQFAAIVINDSANEGVTWTVSCTAAACGSVSPNSTASGATTTYTPPGSLANNLTVTLTAASVADGTKSASLTITVPALSISLTSMSDTLQPGGRTQLTATVTNDGASKGVAWTVSCAASPCGSVSPTSTVSGVATTYNAPATAPASGLTATLTATSVTDATKTASAMVTIPAITVSIAPSSASVPSGGTQQFTATVMNDPNNVGVTWGPVVARLFCDGIQSNRGCNPPGETGVIFLPCTACGTFSPASTASGVPTTYTAPIRLTPPTRKGYFFGGLFIFASVTNTSVSASANLTIAPASVSISPTQAKVVLNATQQFTAIVTNDGTNSGVTWSLMENGVGCSPSCGTIAPTSTASGATTTYTAPATVPALPVFTLTATSVEDTTKSANVTITVTTTSGAACGAGSGSESLLDGQYAFLLHGFDSNGDVATVGSFTADGTGKITAGEEDIHRSPGLETDVSINAAASSYAVGSDHRGCLILANANGQTTYFRFAPGLTNSSGTATAGHIIEFDDTAGTGTRATGTIRLQDATAFTASHFNGNYTFGVAGGFNGRFAMAGTIASDGVSTLTNSSVDVDSAGTITSDASSSPGGSFTCCSANGRGTLQISSSALTVDFCMYLINSEDAFLVSTDVSVASGEAIGIQSGTSFSQASLNGASVIRQTASGPIVDIATANADGKGTLTVNDNVNNFGTFTTGSTLLNYVVASNGRVMTTGGSTPVLYLYGQNQGFLVGTDPGVTFGILEPQTAGPFSNASLSGAYMFGSENPPASTVPLESGVATADGKGNAAGSSDQSSAAGLAQNQPVNLTYSIAADGTGTFGSSTTAILISGNKLVFISNTSSNPKITVVEK